MKWEPSWEQRVVTAFESLPDCPLKQELGELVVALSQHMAQLHCGKAQADGVPCWDTTADCTECLGLSQALAQVRGLLGPPSP